LVNGTGYAIFAIGLAVTMSVIGVLNMAHGELAMLGAILTYSFMTALGLNYFLAGIIAIIAATAHYSDKFPSTLRSGISVR